MPQWRFYRGARRARASQLAGKQCFRHIFICLTVQISCFVTIYIIIWANTQVNLILVFSYYGMPFSNYNVVYTTRKSLENDIGARSFDNNKSAPHFILFRIAAECTISCILIFSAVQTSKTAFQFAEECTIKRPRFQTFLSCSNFKTLFHIAAECTIKQPSFKQFLSSSNFRKHRINSGRLASLILNCYQQFQLQKHRYISVSMHQLASLVSKFSQQFYLPKHRFKYR